MLCSPGGSVPAGSLPLGPSLACMASPILRYPSPCAGARQPEPEEKEFLG